MKSLRVTVTQQENHLHVLVEMRSSIYKGNGTNRKIWQTPEVLKYIKKNHPQYKIDSTVKHAYVSNFQPLHMQGEWVFLLHAPPQKSPKRAPPPPVSTPEKKEKTQTQTTTGTTRVVKKKVKKIRRIIKSTPKEA